jgi:Leucine-rich repeat (LRR) protein
MCARFCLSPPGGNYLGPTVPENIGQLGSLTHLDISRNGVTALGEALFGLTRLSTLVLSRNSIAELPALIGQLTALTCLKVRFVRALASGGLRR